MAQALIFDMDGVIIDSNPFHKAAWQQFCKEHHCEMDDEKFNKAVSGKTNHDACRAIFGDKKSDGELLNLARQKEALFRSLIQPKLTPVSGLVAFLELAKQRFDGLAVATSAPIENVDFTLDQLNLRRFFPVIVYDKDVEKGKPDPAVYLMAAQKLGMRPEDCLVIEDSLAGIESARNAHMAVIGITTTHSRAELSSKVDLVIDDFLGLESKLDGLFPLKAHP